MQANAMKDSTFMFNLPYRGCSRKSDPAYSNKTSVHHSPFCFSFENTPWKSPGSFLSIQNWTHMIVQGSIQNGCSSTMTSFTNMTNQQISDIFRKQLSDQIGEEGRGWFGQQCCGGWGGDAENYTALYLFLFYFLG